MNTVTMGGLILGLALLIHQLITWWPGLKHLKSDPVSCVQDLLPFAYAFSYGMLAILCVGGLVGAAADFVLWGSNWLGDAAYVWGVGGSAQTSATRPAVSALTEGGNGMVLLLTTVYLALLKKKQSLRKELKMGAWSGVCLGLSKGVAGAAAVPLASLVNVAGAWMSTQVLT